MLKYGFYILAGIYSVYLLFYLVTFTRTAPAGDAIGWSRNIFSRWFGTEEKGKSSLYKTMDYTIGPDSTKEYSFTQRETNLLAAKSKFVTVMMYEQIKVMTPEVSYLKEIQPCMQYYDEQIDAFANGNYTIVIDSTKNSKTFKEEITILKKENGYDGGVF